jgi:hypothetical protein
MSVTNHSVQHVFGDDHLTAVVESRHEALWLTLSHPATGRSWGPTLLMAMEIHDRTVRREERFEKYRVESIVSGKQGLEVVVSGSIYTGVTAGLSLKIVDGELVVTFKAAQVRESAADRSRLMAVDVLPSLMTARGEGARLLLPINGGTLCKPLGKAAASDRFLLYLEQPRWELSTILPICGSWEEGKGGLMAIATQAAGETQGRVVVDGHGSGHTGFAFCLRQQWGDPVEQSARELHFTPIPPDADPVLFVAKRLRKHVMKDLKKVTLKERAAQSPEVAYQLRAMTIKLFHGMQNRGACIYDNKGLPENHFWNTMTFAEAGEAMNRLRRLGVEGLYTQSVGWNARGHDGLYPTRFPIEERVGGEAGFRDMLKAGAELGYHCTVHDNFQMNIPDAPDWNTDHLIHDIHGEPLVRGFWAGGTEYATWPGALPAEKVGGHLRRLKELGIKGMFYCDYWMAPLEVNYHPKHKGTRTAHNAGMVAVLEEAKKIFGSVATEFGTLPGAVACDTIACHLPYGFLGAVRNRTEWASSKLVDEAVPIWALALHGLVMHQASGGPTWHNAMDAVAWGAVARDEFAVRSLPMGGVHLLDERRTAGLAALYELCTKRFSYLITEEMTACDTSTSGVVRTSFADGTHVVANRHTGELVVNGKRIERPAALA